MDTVFCKTSPNVPLPNRNPSKGVLTKTKHYNFYEAGFIVGLLQLSNLAFKMAYFIICQQLIVICF